MQVVVVEVRLVCKEYLYFILLVLDVYLLGTVWFGTHPLLLQLFCRLLAGTFVIFLFSLSEASYGKL